MILNPSSIEQIVIDGSGLTIEAFVAVARFGAKVAISPTALEVMGLSRQVVERIVAEKRVAYGISTGFGDFSKTNIPEEQADLLQNNLILSHCTATGNPYPTEVVRGICLLRANALCGGNSGIRPQLVEALVAMLNAGVHPVIPEKGSLGASGDLAPLSHMALVLLGLGEAEYQGEILPGKQAMAMAGIPTYALKAKEGLALINGTQAMTAVGTLSYYDGLCAAQLSDVIASMTHEALTGLLDAYEHRVHAVRPHPGQIQVAANMRMLAQGSEILAKSQHLRVQDAYSLRCIPQVHGAVRGALEHVRQVIEIELNAVTDNPLIFREDDAVISGGNFHGEPMALPFDYLGIAVSEIASISERRLERLVNGSLSEGLPPFLVPVGGVNSGFMICQYTAASMVSENKVFSHPASVDSIPSSANQEDHVSMGTTAARKSRLIVENTLSVLALELMAAVQGIELRGGAPSPVHQAIFELVREQIPFYDQDREIRQEIAAANSMVRDGRILALVAKMLPDFK